MLGESANAYLDVQGLIPFSTVTQPPATPSSKLPSIAIVRAICEALQSRLALPPGVRVVDFGIRGIDLAFALERVDAAILVDACARGGPAVRQLSKHDFNWTLTGDPRPGAMTLECLVAPKLLRSTISAASGVSWASWSCTSRVRSRSSGSTVSR